MLSNLVRSTIINPTIQAATVTATTRLSRFSTDNIDSMLKSRISYLDNLISKLEDTKDMLAIRHGTNEKIINAVNLLKYEKILRESRSNLQLVLAKQDINARLEEGLKILNDKCDLLNDLRDFANTDTKLDKSTLKSIVTLSILCAESANSENTNALVNLEEKPVSSYDLANIATTLYRYNNMITNQHWRNITSTIVNIKQSFGTDKSKYIIGGIVGGVVAIPVTIILTNSWLWICSGCVAIPLYIAYTKCK